MLQQTRVETVIPYYRRFMERYPSLPALAKARLPGVLKAWEGLGYYRRARHLHRAARDSLRLHGGFAPSFEAFAKLPGVGPYTAAAVWAIAFEEPRLPLDGNVRRVLSRLFDLDTWRAGPYHEAGQPLLEDLGSREIPAMAQSIMELGALVCLPRGPACPRCPLRRHCHARARGVVAGRPPVRPKKTAPHYNVVIAYLSDGRGRVLLAQRPENVLLGGMWELPGGKARARESLEKAIRRELREELGIRQLRELRRLGKVAHAYTHFKVTLHLFDAKTSENPGKLDGPVAARWVIPARVSTYPLPRGTQKALALRERIIGMQ
jgi:A/G-specific adenine glycosylase